MKQIEKIIERSFRELKIIAKIAYENGTVNQDQNSKLIFPKKRIILYELVNKKCVHHL